MISAFRPATRTLLARAALPRQARVAVHAAPFSTSPRALAIQTRYTPEHEWVSIDDETNIGTVGITDYAQKSLGDVVFVELPAKHSEVKQGARLRVLHLQPGPATAYPDDIGAVESVKAASDIYAPVTGVVESVNEKLSSQPGLLNKDPEGEGMSHRHLLPAVSSRPSCLCCCFVICSAASRLDPRADRIRGAASPTSEPRTPRIPLQDPPDAAQRVRDAPHRRGLQGGLRELGGRTSATSGEADCRRGENHAEARQTNFVRCQIAQRLAGRGVESQTTRLRCDARRSVPTKSQKVACVSALFPKKNQIKKSQVKVGVGSDGVCLRNSENQRLRGWKGVRNAGSAST
ncbi:glycine cleavage system H-protein subunit [Thecaphora frezii]